MASIRKYKKKDGSFSYQVQIRRTGFPHIKQNFSDEETAKAWTAQIEEQYTYQCEQEKFNRFSGKSIHNKHLFSDVIKRYMDYHLPKIKDGERRKSQLQWWEKQFSNKFIDEITPEMIEKKLNELSKTDTRFKKQISEKTIQRYCAALSHVFTIATKDWKLLQTHPVMLVNLPGHEKRTRTGNNQYHKEKFWYFVEKKLPPKDTPVLALDINNFYAEVACYNPANEPDDPKEPTGWETQSCVLLPFRPTHWMHIPEFPFLEYAEELEEQQGFCELE